jgi:hypothetical protein
MVEALDIVRFDYATRLEDPAQPENVLIDESDWILVGAVPPQQAYGLLRPYLAFGPALLGGTEKGVPDDVAQNGMAASLTLVEPDSISFRSQNNPFRPGSRQARAVFEIASQSYDFSITDRVVAPTVMKAGDGSYSAGELGFPQPAHTLLTVSLAEPLRGIRWKLVAAVMFLP